VQSVERNVLTEGYKRKDPLFHKLFLSGVENWETPAKQSGASKSQAPPARSTG
jgi:flagellar hook protein FlgE